MTSPFLDSCCEVVLHTYILGTVTDAQQQNDKRAKNFYMVTYEKRSTLSQIYHHCIDIYTAIILLYHRILRSFFFIFFLFILFPFFFYKILFSLIPIIFIYMYVYPSFIRNKKSFFLMLYNEIQPCH